MHEIWYYDRDSHTTDIVIVNSIEELYDWFIRSRGYTCSVIIKNICEHREDEDGAPE